MDEKIQSLRDRLAELEGQGQQLMAAADAEGRDLSQDEMTRVEQIRHAIEHTEREIHNREQLQIQSDRIRKGQGRRTEPEPAAAGAGGLAAGDGPGPRPADRPGHRPADRVPAELLDRKMGFKNIGEYYLAVYRAGQDAGHLDPRLKQLAPSGFMNEGSGSDGGFAIPPDFRQEIVQKVSGEDSLLPRTSRLTTDRNSITMLVDETEPWSASGIRVYWEAEAATLRDSKPVLSPIDVKLHKMAALAYVTDEMLEDAPYLESYLKAEVPSRMTYKINEAILFGTGVGQPAGAFGSASKVRQTKESGQTADTVVYDNVSKMWSRLYSGCRANAVWLNNQDVEPQLDKMYIPTGSAVGQVVYLPPGGLSASRYGTLRGRPVIALENCKALGDEGDFMLWDPTTYATVTKTGSTGVRTDMSIHCQFDRMLTAFRFVFRLGGISRWKSTITRANSALPLGNLVTLEDR